MAVTFLSREETRRFAGRLRAEFVRRRLSVAKGCELLGINRRNLERWHTESPSGGRRIRYDEALRLAEPWGVELPRPRVVPCEFSLPDGDYEEWLDTRINSLNSAKGSQKSDVGVLIAVLGSLTTRWANLHLDVGLVVDYTGKRHHPYGEIIITNVHLLVDYIVRLLFEDGSVMLDVESRPKAGKLKHTRSPVVKTSPHGACLLGLEKLLLAARDKVVRRRTDRGEKPAKMLEDLRQDIRNFCEPKQKLTD